MLYARIRFVFLTDRVIAGLSFLYEIIMSYSEKTLHDILKSRWKDYGTALIHYEHTLPTAADGMELSLRGG